MRHALAPHSAWATLVPSPVINYMGICMEPHVIDLGPTPGYAAMTMSHLAGRLGIAVPSLYVLKYMSTPAASTNRSFVACRPLTSEQGTPSSPQFRRASWVMPLERVGAHRLLNISQTAVAA